MKASAKKPAPPMRAMGKHAPGPMPFSKMQGAGNDFVLLDLRDGHPPPGPDLAARLADRHRGVGCDQVLTIEPPHDAGAVASYRVWNADGSRSQQCGNGARCVAAWRVRDGAARNDRFGLDSPAGRHAGQRLANGDYAVAMGRPVFEPQLAPLQEGDLRIQWPEDAAGMVMSGPAAFVFDGEWLG